MKQKKGRPVDSYKIVKCPPVTYHGFTVDDLYRPGTMLPDFNATLKDGSIPDGTLLERDGERYIVQMREVVKVENG